MGSILRRYRGRRQLLLLFIAMLLGLGVLAGCGGEDSSSDTTASATETTAPSNEGAESETPEDEGEDAGEEVTEAEVEGSDSDADSSPKQSNDGGAEKVAVPPNKHKDSGGGSKQFRTKGGDNSIQDFGKEAQGEEFATVAAIVHAFLDARAAGNSAEVCKYMSSRIVDEMKQFASQAPDPPKDCAGLIDMFTAPMTPKLRRTIAKADIASVRAEEDAAFVLYRGHQKQVFLLPMAREDGQWKVAAIAASPMP